MLVKYHAAVSTVISSGLYAATDSWQLAAASLVSGILVDADHFVEYLVEYGVSLDPGRFIRLVHEARYERVFYLLHAWEWFALGLAAAWAAGWNAWSAGLLIGYGQHLVLDHFGNKGTPWSYFLFWRWKQGFDHVRCFPGQAEALSRTEG